MALYRGFLALAIVYVKDRILRAQLWDGIECGHHVGRFRVERRSRMHFRSCVRVN